MKFKHKTRDKAGAVRKQRMKANFNANKSNTQLENREECACFQKEQRATIFSVFLGL
jgi:hypothetical protein